MDHDGDSVSVKPINSVEAVEECNAINNNLLQVFDFAGDFRRSVGKEPVQLMYTFTRDPKPNERPKTIPANHPLIQHIMGLKDGELEISTLYKYTVTFDENKKPEVEFYDNVTITRLGKKVETTVGRLIYNKVLFGLLWDNKHFPYINEQFNNKKFENACKLIGQLQIEKKCPSETVSRVIDLNTEMGMRLSTIYNAGLTSSMMMPSDEFVGYRDKVIDSVKDKVLETGDINLLSDAEDKVIDYAKKYFKNDDMFEMYASGAKAKWDNDFKNLQVSTGALPSIVGGKPVVIFNSLNQGIDPEYLPDWVNVGVKGATDRGLQTALAGAEFKDINNAGQGIYGYRGDCGSTKGLEEVYTDKFKLLNRYVIMPDGSQVKVTLDNVDKFLNKKITVRNVIYCRHKDGSYCSHCIGETPFEYMNRDKIPIGLLTSDASSKLLNMFMKSTHSLSASTFIIENINDFIRPTLTKPLFELRKDPIDGVDKFYCLEDIEWRIPLSAITPEDTSYRVLAHGSILSSGGSGDLHAIVLGTEVYSKPSEFIKPDLEEHPELSNHVIFKYYKGDIFLQSTITYRKEMTVYKMFKLFMQGSVSNLVPFETHLETMKNTIASNRSVAINDLSLGILLSSLARDINDVSKPARETGTSQYKFVSLNDLVALSGTFSALFGGDVAKSLLININKPEKEQTKVVSSIEKALRY